MNENQKRITADTVDKMAKLSKLELSYDQKQKLERELCEIVEYAGKLKKREAGEDILIPEKNALRDDIPLSFNNTDSIIACAKTQEGRFISVPAVVATEPDKDR